MLSAVTVTMCTVMVAVRLFSHGCDDSGGFIDIVYSGGCSKIVYTVVEVAVKADHSWSAICIIWCSSRGGVI